MSLTAQFKALHADLGKALAEHEACQSVSTAVRVHNLTYSLLLIALRLSRGKA